MFLMLVMLMISFMIVFPNVLLYTISLLVISVSLLLFLVSMNYISALLFLLIVIVYVGAMMVLIGYICAVCPNFFTTNYFNYFLLFSTIFLFFLFSPIFMSQNSSKFGTLSDYFFSTWGSLVFFLIAIMLFITLIMVTSQYNSPQGPFRSL